MTIGTSVPVLGVGRCDLAEVQRALRLSGRDAHVGQTVRYLWIARALPACLDVLSDARAPVGQGMVQVHRADVELHAWDIDAHPTPSLFAVAVLEGGGTVVRVSFMTHNPAVPEAPSQPRDDLEASGTPPTVRDDAAHDGTQAFREDVPQCTVRFAVSRHGRDDDDVTSSVTLRRFSLRHPP